MGTQGNKQTSATTIKILGQEYRLRADIDPTHLQRIAEYVDRVMRQVRESTSDTQDAAVVTALNIASELLSTRGLSAVPSERIQALIDLIDSA